MKTLVEKWNISTNHSFNVTNGPLINHQKFMMRVHNEMELSILMGCTGKRFLGNTIENFSDGDFFLLGPNLPHSLEIDDNQIGERVTIHFLVDSFGKGFFELPENREIAKLFAESSLGISFKNVDVNRIYRVMSTMHKLEPFERMISFFNLLNELAKYSNRKTLSSPGFAPLKNDKDYIKVNNIYHYIMTRFNEQAISLDEISSHVNMAPATFCRYFKRHFNKTLTEFLNEVRIGHSCKLLVESDKNITEICFDSGYNQLTHFNRQFKKIIGYSPKKYRQKYRLQPS